MKKFYSLCLLSVAALASPLVSTAQTVFAPHGAEWWYEWQGLVIPGSYTHVRVANDSVVGGYNARKVLVESVTDTGGGYQTQVYNSYLVRTDGDQVLRWDPATGAYVIELDFGRPVGATWTTPSCIPGSPFTCSVDSVRQLSVGGAWLRLQYSSTPSGTASPFFCFAQERIGALGSILFPAPICGPGVPEASLVLLSYADGAVRLGTAPLGRAETVQSVALRVAPNPSVSGQFRLEGLADQGVNYEVFDAQGRRVSTGYLTAAGPMVDLTTQGPGLYLLHGTLAGKAFTRRLVRN
jgi:hypothetical protein